MGSFGSVIPVTGLNYGFPGTISRVGGGDPYVVAKQANSANGSNINFGDTVVVLPDSTGGTYKQLADWIANGGGAVLTTVNLTSGSATATPTSLAGIAPGMFLKAADGHIPAGTFVVSVNQAAGTITMSQNASANSTGTNLFVAVFGGIAVREVKTQLGTFPYSPSTAQTGYYAPGDMCEALVRGSISAVVHVGTPIQDGSIYVRFVANGSIPAGVVGGLEAAPDGANNVLLNNAVFKTGALDSNNVAEVTFLNRVSA